MDAVEDTKGGRSPRKAISGSLVVRSAFALSAIFLLAGLALYGLAALKLIQPEVLGSEAMLSYGRVLPAGANLLVFGWLTLALFGVALHAVPRLAGTDLALPLPALGLVLLVAAGAGGGAGLVMLGDNAGGRWMEFPMIADGVLLAAFLGLAGLLALTARRGSGGLPVAGWYLVASPLWLFLAYVVGAIPGVTGLGGEVQAGFAGAALFGVWLAPAAVGAAYYAVQLVAPDAEFHERLGRIGFWSLTFTWLWTGGRLLQYGPTNDWVETIPVVFGVGLVVASIAIAADFAHALRGRRDDVRQSPVVRLVITSLGFLVAATALSFVASLRSVSAVVRFTPWESGVEQALLLGAFTMAAMAGLAAIATATRGRPWGAGFSFLVIWPVTLGALVAAGSRFMAGLDQGYGWLAAVQSGGYANAGGGFAVTSNMEGLDTVGLVGIGLWGVGVVFFVLRMLLLGFGGSTEPTPASSHPGDRVAVDGLLRRAVAVFALAALATVYLPILDSSGTPSALAESSRDLSGIAADGRDLYISEGCWYCHTQQVRSIVTDLGLGPASVAGDYVYDPVGLPGVARVGPDLAHAAQRDLTAVWINEHLINPRAASPSSVMPSYGYLTESELVSLAIYVSGLE